jgi:hypothetical protein
MCAALRERPWREAMRGFHQMSQKQRVIAEMNCIAVHQMPSLRSFQQMSKTALICAGVFSAFYNGIQEITTRKRHRKQRI